MTLLYHEIAITEKRALNAATVSNHGIFFRDSRAEP